MCTDTFAPGGRCRSFAPTRTLTSLACDLLELAGFDSSQERPTVGRVVLTSTANQNHASSTSGAARGVVAISVTEHIQLPPVSHPACVGRDFCMSAFSSIPRFIAHLVFIASVVSAATFGVALSPAPAEAASEDRLRTAQSIALSQRGDPYSYGSAGPNAFDCSGLIQYAYSRAGISIPRTSGAQAAATRRVAKDDMRPGDLMFFADSGDVYHAAIFLGWKDGHATMVQSQHPGTSVNVAAPWTSSWFGGTLR